MRGTPCVQAGFAVGQLDAEETTPGACPKARRYMPLETLRMIHTMANVLTVPVSIFVAVLYAPRYGYSRKNAAAYAAKMIILIVLFAYAFYYALMLFGIMEGLNSYRTYLLVPLFAYLVSAEQRITALQGADFMIPALLIVRAMVLITCNFVGCSLAMPCDWGIYNPTVDQYVFPMDLIDLIATTLVAIFAFYYAKKLHYKGEGRVFAMSMCLLGIVRMFNQFACTEMWWVRGFNDETIYSVVSIITAIVIFNRYKKQLNVKTEESL